MDEQHPGLIPVTMAEPENMMLCPRCKGWDQKYYCGLCGLTRKVPSAIAVEYALATEGVAEGVLASIAYDIRSRYGWDDLKSKCGY